MYSSVLHTSSRALNCTYRSWAWASPPKVRFALPATGRETCPARQKRMAFAKAGKVDTICISLLRDVGPTAKWLYLSDLLQMFANLSSLAYDTLTLQTRLDLVMYRGEVISVKQHSENKL